MVSTETVTTIIANIVGIIVVVTAGARWVWSKVRARFEGLEEQVGHLGTTVALLSEAENERDPEFYEKVKRMGRTVGLR